MQGEGKNKEQLLAELDELRERLAELEKERAERKKAEDVLHRSEERYRMLYESLREAYALVSMDGRITECNTLFCDLVGYSPGELSAMTYRDITPEHWHALEDSIISEQVVARGYSEVYEKEYCRKDETIIPVELRTILSRDALGRAQSMWAFVRDITRRKQLEADLQSLSKQRQLALDAASLGWWRCDPVTGIATYDGRFAEIFDVEGSRRPNKEILERMHPDDLPGVWAKVEAALDPVTPRPFSTEYRVYRSDGSIRWVEAHGMAVFEGNGQTGASLVGTVQDISDRKQAEERLRASEHFLQSILSSSPTLIYIYDIINRQNVFANQEIVDFLGYTPEQVQTMGSNLFLNILHPNDAALVADHHARFSTALDDEVLEVEYRLKDSKGEWRWLHSQDVLFARTSEGLAWQILGSAQDITERKHAEKEREALQAQLNQAQKMESVGRLAGGVAHDFNNSLGVVLGYTEMALQMTNPDQPIFADLKEIEKAARRSAELTRQLLAFARQQTISPRVLDLNETVEGMLKMLRRLIGENISLAWLPGNNLWPVKVDPSQVDQILANLCVNSRDAIPGTGTVTIETQNVVLDKASPAEHEGDVSGECVLLTVRDDGSGMDREIMERVFDPFFTTKEPGKGTGLGLATVYGIVKQNNGLIDVCSEPGKGTAFNIFLPRYTAEVEKIEQVDPEVPANGSAETILLVEDEPANLKMAKRMLRRLGYTVLLAGTPGEAIRIAKEHPGKVRLLMTDVVMPEMNGRDLAENILALNPDIKILFMSGYTADVIAYHGVLGEEVHFIQKPFSMQELASKLQEMLGESEID